MKRINIFIIIFIFIAGAFIAHGVLAVEGIPAGFSPLRDDIQKGEQLVDTVEGVIQWIFVAFLLAAIVFVILAAFQFLSGGGDPQQIVQARQKLIWAAVAVIVATLSRAIPTVVNNIVGG